MYSYVARQPILDRNQNIYAYELLFRDGKDNCFPDVSSELATASILTNNHLTLGLEQVTGNLPAFINFNESLLLKHFPSFIEPSKIVIEILEDVPPSEEVFQVCKQLKNKGYKLALDDYNLDPKWFKFFSYIDIIKIDILDVPHAKIINFVLQVRELNVLLLAEKVESSKQFEQLKALGFSLFQGYFFSKPQIIKQKRISTTKQGLLQLFSHSLNSSLDFDAISHIFSADPGLTYKLLRFINSSAWNRQKEITSLKHALTYIGELELKKFIALVTLADLNQDKPSEIIKTSLIRAKFCEKISRLRREPDNPPKAFLTGMLSLIDTILDQDISTVLAILPVDTEIESALVKGDNYLANYLTLAKYLEQAQWQESNQLIAQLNIETSLCLEAHQEAIAWSDVMLDNS